MSEEEKYVSGEEYEAMKQQPKPAKRKQVTLRISSLSRVVIVVVLCILSFVSGVAYEQHHAKTTTVTASSTAGATGSNPGGTGFRNRGSIGQVTAVSDSSITITNQRTNASQTYSITSSTTIDDNGQTVAASDIQVGDTVLISVSSTGSTQASRIMVNPSFGGGFGQGSSSATPNDSTTQSN